MVSEGASEHDLGALIQTHFGSCGYAYISTETQQTPPGPLASAYKTGVKPQVEQTQNQISSYTNHTTLNFYPIVPYKPIIMTGFAKLTPAFTVQVCCPSSRPQCPCPCPSPPASLGMTSSTNVYLTNIPQRSHYAQSVKSASSPPARPSLRHPSWRARQASPPRPTTPSSWIRPGSTVRTTSRATRTGSMSG
jgi:hypothetical protein